jgi:hypothetical protein
MKIRFALLPSILALLSISHAADCGSDKVEYADLNQPLRVSYAGEQAYLSVREAQTDRLHAFAADRIAAKLGSGIDSPSEIVAYVQCLQSLVPENAVATNLTNLPLAFFSRTHAPAIVVGYDTYRGWGAVPDDRYYFDAFSKEDGQWRLVGSIGSSFDGYTLFVHPINAGRPGEEWFLFSGSAFGNNADSLRLEVVAYDGSSLKSVWQDSSLKRTSLEGVFGDHILLSEEGTDKSGHYYEFQRRLNVVATGLKEAESDASIGSKGLDEHK